MRRLCCAVALLLVGTMVGCQTQFEPRAYQLGPKPKAALEVIKEITIDEIKQHRQVMKDVPVGKKVPLYNVIEDEGVVVVRTSPQGHHRIETALKNLRDMPTK